MKNSLNNKDVENLVKILYESRIDFPVGKRDEYGSIFVKIRDKLEALEKEQFVIITAADLIREFKNTLHL